MSWCLFLAFLAQGVYFALWVAPRVYTRGASDVGASARVTSEQQVCMFPQTPRKIVVFDHKCTFLPKNSDFQLEIIDFNKESQILRIFSRRPQNKSVKYMIPY